MQPVLPAVQALLSLYTTDLAGLRFGEIDGALLAQRAADTEAAAEVVREAQAALDAARTVLAERQEELLLLAHRALAHARLYAEEQPALASRLEPIALPRPSRRTRGDDADALVLTGEPHVEPKKRGRPKKVAEDVSPAPESMTLMTG